MLFVCSISCVFHALFSPDKFPPLTLKIGFYVSIAHHIDLYSSLNLLEFQCNAIVIIDTGPFKMLESCCYDDYVVLHNTVYLHGVCVQA